jgi:hypothetical protein
MLLVQKAERGWTWELVDEAGRTFASGRSSSQEAALAAAQWSYSLFDGPPPDAEHLPIGVGANGRSETLHGLA